MKRLIYILIILIPAALSAGDARVERWQSRIERISKYRNEDSRLSGGGTEAGKIFSDEIRSAEEFISVLNRYSSGDGSVKAESRRYTVEEIESITSSIADPVVTIYYMAEMIKEPGNPVLKSSLKDEINSYASKKGLPVIKKESREAELLAGKYIMQRYLSGYEKWKKKAVADILGLTEYELSRTGYSSNEIDLAEIILNGAEKISSQGINREAGFNEAFLTALPEWMEIEKSASVTSSRTEAAAAFVLKEGVAVTPDDRSKGVSHIGSLIFSPKQASIKAMCENTEKTPAAGYNSPMYEIPDFSRIVTALDDIDNYRNSLIRSMTGSEGPGFAQKVRGNNKGLAMRQMKVYETLFKREKMRISALKRSNSSLIIYNEEIFNTAEKHFSDIREKVLAYAELSSDFIEALYSSWKTNPEEYLDSYRKKTLINIDTISFLERLSSDSVPAGKTGKTGISTLFRACAGEIFPIMKNLYTAEKIPAEIRGAMTAEQVREFAGINENLRIKGTALAVSARKNTELFSAGYSDAVASRKEGIIASETSIGQDEVDRLFSCAKKFSDHISGMDYTGRALRNYSDKYKEIADDIDGGKDLSTYLESINSGSIIPLVKDFSAEKIDSEMKIRELLVREGKESLSGAVALMQYYSRRGFKLKFTLTAGEIKEVEDKFSITSEVQVSSWKMNGKNYRFIDTNAAESLKKMINRKAWHQDIKTETGGEKENFSPDGKFSFAISLPEGWKRAVGSSGTGTLSLSLQSPDLLGRIVLYAEKPVSVTLKEFSDDWQKKNGFTPVAKEWGKIKGNDYLVTVSRNSFDSVMESYYIKNGDYIILISGTSGRTRYSSMKSNLKYIFSSLEISGPHGLPLN